MFRSSALFHLKKPKCHFRFLGDFKVKMLDVFQCEQEAELEDSKWLFEGLYLIQSLGVDVNSTGWHNPVNKEQSSN